MIRYDLDEGITGRVHDIVGSLNMRHVDLDRVVCVRSHGSKSKRILARCHVLSRIFQKALGVRTHYIIEVISEKFDGLSPEEQTKVLIHEVMHIPKSFGGGFKHHNYVNKRTVDHAYEKYKSTKQYLERYGIG
jgi:predicted metallopeptidase